MAWSNDATRLWVVGEDSAVYQFAIEANETPTAIAVKPLLISKVEQPLKSLVSNDPQSFVGITPDKKTQWWGMTVATAEVPSTLQKVDRLGDVADVVGLARYEEAGVSRILVASGDGNVRVVQGTDGAVLRTIGHGAAIHHVIAAGDSSKFATIGADGLIKTWKSADGAMLWEQKVDSLGQSRIEQAELALARHKSKVDRATAKVPELEKAKQAETEAHGKLQTSRTQIMEELGKKQAEEDGGSRKRCRGQEANAACGDQSKNRSGNQTDDDGQDDRDSSASDRESHRDFGAVPRYARTRKTEDPSNGTGIDPGASRCGSFAGGPRYVHRRPSEHCDGPQ
jgi:hypothetical protein